MLFFKYLPLLLLLLLHVEGWGQISESFETGLPTSYTSTTTYTLSSGVWTGSANHVIRSTTGKTQGSYSLQLRSQTGAQITTPTLVGGVGTISFDVQASTSSGGLQIRVSTNDGVSWTQVTGSPISFGTSNSSRSFNINNSAVNKVQFYRTGATVYIDNVVITSSSTAPTGVTTGSAGSISAVGAIISSNDVTGDGGAAITERGVVYGTSANPTLSNSKQVVAGTTGTFSATLGGLSNSTSYYVRAYATNSVGTTYGSQIDFTTLAPAGSTASDIIENTGFSYTSNINYSSFVNAGPLTNANSLKLTLLTISQLFVNNKLINKV